MTMESVHERIDINEFSTEYIQHNLSPNARGENEGQFGKPNDKKGCYTKYCANLNHINMGSLLWWFKCHWTGKIVGSLLQLLLIGDVASDLIFLWTLFTYHEGLWFFYSALILYLSLRFTLVFTATFEEYFYKSYDVWDTFHKVTKFGWHDKAHKPSLGTITLLFIPGAWHFVYFFHIIIKRRDKFDTTLCFMLWLIFIGLPYFVLYLVLYVPFLEVMFIPTFVYGTFLFVLGAHVIKGIIGVWKTNSVSFYENSYKVQTFIFYSTTISFFESITESLPQFLLQSWIFYHSEGLIPNSIYYLSVFFSILSILKSIVVFITMRKELTFSIIRLANNIVELDDGTLQMKLEAKEEDLIIQMVQVYSNSNVQHLDVSKSKFTDDGLKEIVKYLSQLNSLDVSKTKITDKSLLCIAENCLQLDTLNLEDTSVTDEGLIIVAENCLQLKTLHLQDTSVTDEGLLAIAENCRQLKTLNLQNTSVTDEGLLAIAENCLELEIVYLQGTIVTDTSVSYLLFKCKELSILIVPNNQFSITLKNKYRRKYPHIKIYIW